LVIGGIAETTSHIPRSYKQSVSHYN